MVNYDNFFLPTDNLEQAKFFYSDTLGLHLKFEFPEKGMAAFSVGNDEPAIILKDINKHPHAKPTIWFVVENVMEKYGELQSKGIKFLSEPYHIGTGQAVEFEDGYGNRLGITDYTK